MGDRSTRKERPAAIRTTTIDGQSAGRAYDARAPIAGAHVRSGAAAAKTSGHEVLCRWYPQSCHL